MSSTLSIVVLKGELTFLLMSILGARGFVLVYRNDTEGTFTIRGPRVRNELRCLLTAHNCELVLQEFVGCNHDAE
jgi:hypothetical protein